MTRTIEIPMTITRCKRFGTGLASKRVDIFEVDAVAIVEYSFDGSRLDWVPMAFRFEALRDTATETLDRDDPFFAALEAALDMDFVAERIFDADQEYQAACADEREAEKADYRRSAL